MKLQDFDAGERLYFSNTSEVYRAFCRPLEKQVVIKRLRGTHPSTARVRRFRREYDLLKQFSDRGDKGIVKLLGLIDEGLVRALVLEDFGGIPLEKFAGGKRVETGALLETALKLTGLLETVHARGIIHRDVNPHNILVHPETGEVKLIDFNIAASFSLMDTGFRRPDTIAGTLGYISPEQTGRMNRSVDYRSDYYALGVVLYELATGERPFAGGDPHEMIYAHIALSPIPPATRNPEIPEMLSAIILKLMRKGAAERYRSTAGIRWDLETCLAAVKGEQPLKAYSLGQKDRAGIPRPIQKLHGRRRELESLLGAYREVAGGKRRMVTVSGAAGAGKTSLVRELHRPVTGDRGIFVSGKFERLERNTPCSGFVQALEGFAELLPAREPEVLARWKERLNSALGPLGGIVAGAVPALGRIMGVQPDLPSLDGAASRNRFFYAWLLLFREIASGEQPLVLFLDDLQWADQISLDLLGHLLRDEKISRFLPVCAFRDGEAPSDHSPSEIKAGFEGGPEVVSVVVGDLGREDILGMLDEAVGPGPGLEAAAGLIHEKTRGNPFFARRFLLDLHREGLLWFDGRRGEWRWDLASAGEMDFTDNVLELLGAAMEKLPPLSREILESASCLGNRFSSALLSAACGREEGELVEALGRCAEEGLIHYDNDALFGFVHDRVRQAAYERTLPEKRIAVHKRAGRYLGQTLSPREKEDRLFEITDHLFRGEPENGSPGEKEALARLAFKAGQRARASGVFERALEYFMGGISLFGESLWELDYSLALRMYTEASASAGLSGRHGEMERLGEMVHQRASSVLDRVGVCVAAIQAENASGKRAEAVETALSTLSLLGERFPAEPDEALFVSEFQRTMPLVAGMDETTLPAENRAPDQRSRAVMIVLNAVADAVYHARPALLPHMVFRQVRFSLEQGICPESAPAFALFGLILCGPVGDLDTGVEMGRIAEKILERKDARPHAAKTLLVVNNCIMHWKVENRNGLPRFREAARAGLETGDLPFASVSLHAWAYNALFTAMPLSALHKKMAAYDRNIDSMGQLGTLNFHRCYYQVVENLMARADAPGRLAGPVFNGEARLPELIRAGDRTAVFVVHFCRVFLGTLLGEAALVAEALDAAKAHMDGAVALIHIPMLTFYDALHLLSRYGAAPSREKKRIREKLGENRRLLRKWAAHAPSNHGAKHLLVEAWCQRLWGRRERSEALFERAVARAVENGYLHEEYLIREHRAGFYFETGRFGEGMGELQRAHRAAQKWGAEALVARLSQRYFRHLSGDEKEVIHGSGKTTTTTASFMDTRSIVSAVQALSAEVETKKLLEKMTEIMIKNAGAVRGFFMEYRGGAFIVQAACRENRMDRILSGESIAGGDDLPVSVLNYVVQTRAPVLLESLEEDPRFQDDPVLGEGGDRSLICAPVIHKGNLLALIYLENSLAKGVFTRNQLELVTLLAGQAAISLENAKLYDTLDRKVRERTRALARANEELRHLASVDKLTGIANRRIFDEVLQREWGRLEREGAPLSVLLCDIDHFKNYNDTYGHQKGDECLALVARAVKGAVRRPGDLAARYGGEEFGIILPGTDVGGAVETAENIRKAVLALKLPNGGAQAEEFVTLSLGAATVVPEAEGSWETLLKASDRALYRSKAMGRNRVSSAL